MVADPSRASPSPPVPPAPPGLPPPRHHWPTIGLTLAIGVAAGALARALGAPLPWLLGALIVTSVAAIRDWRPMGHLLGLPAAARMGAIPVLGVAIGGAFTPEVLGAVGRWWPSLLALALYVPVAQWIGYRIARRMTPMNRATAFYGTMPGGFIESIQLGETTGADMALLMTMQFLRLILCIVAIPVGFSLLTGHAVGSASGAVIGGGHTLSALDWVLLAATGAAGALAGRALRLPAWLITGPILASGAVHLAGLVEGVPPGWLISAVQVLIGANLGMRFAGRSPRVLLTAARITVVTVSVTFLLAGVFAAALHRLVGESWQAVFLGFAPGGVTEMSLVALSLEISVIYVTLHHVVRILMAVTLARQIGPQEDTPEP